MSRIQERLRELLWQEQLPNRAEALRLTEQLIPGDLPDTLCWPDIPYMDVSRNVWRAAAHYIRLREAIIAGGEQRLSTDPEWRALLFAVLRYWLLHDYRNPNWWHNDIGMPKNLSDIGILLLPFLPQELFGRLCELVGRGSMKTRQDIPRWTGANLIWGAYDTIKHALLTQDADLMRAASLRIAEEMHYSREGIQPDGAFCQHGPRWYSGGYGASFTLDVGRIVYLLQQTEFQLPEDRLRILLHHVLDGQRVMMHRGYFDFNGVGREITRRNALRVAPIHEGVGLLCRTTGLPRADELSDFAAELKGAICRETTCFYPSVSLCCHQHGGVYIGIKGHNAEQYDAEVCNSEGELCYNMSYGTHTCLMSRGDEYLDLNPVFDYAHVPGTTARLENDGQLLAHRSWWNLPLPNNFTRGLVSSTPLGDCAVLAQTPVHDGISGQVAFFAIEGCLVALGAGFCDSTPEKGALTVTLDQCWPRDVWVAPDHREATCGDFRYRTLDPDQPMHAGVALRDGSWWRNSFEEDFQPIRGKEVYTAWIPVRGDGGTYAYLISPRNETPSVTVLCNRPERQEILWKHTVRISVTRSRTVCETHGLRNPEGAEDDSVRITVFLSVPEAGETAASPEA